MSRRRADLVTLTEFARRLGVTREAVRQAGQSGRITVTNGKVDPVRARREWRDRTHPPGHGGQNRGKRQPRAAKARPAPDLKPGEWTAEGPSFASMRARREAASAALAELDLARKRGEVAPVADMRAAVFALNRRARDMLLSLPDRLAPRLSMLEQVAIHAILVEELTRVCHEIADARPL